MGRLSAGMLYHDQAKHPEAIHYLRQFIELAGRGVVPPLAGKSSASAAGEGGDKTAVGTAYTAFSSCLKVRMAAGGTCMRAVCAQPSSVPGKAPRTGA
jgi:hypothetical protein